MRFGRFPARSVLVVDGVSIEVSRRQQKNMYVRVKPPDARVCASAPLDFSDERIERVIRERMDWIQRQRFRMTAERARQSNAPTPEELSEWRLIVAAFTPPLIEKWAPILGVKPGALAYRNMVSRWGSCNVKTGRICINVQLAAFPPECLEYVVVHELCHLIEANHGPRFKALLDAHLPDWRTAKAKLAGGIRR